MRRWSSSKTVVVMDAFKPFLSVAVEVSPEDGLATGTDVVVVVVQQMLVGIVPTNRPLWDRSVQTLTVSSFDIKAGVIRTA